MKYFWPAAKAFAITYGLARVAAALIEPQYWQSPLPPALTAALLAAGLAGAWLHLDGAKTP